VTVTSPPQVRERTRAKARVLLEALPFIREHAGATVVVKIGGAAMEDPALGETFAMAARLGIEPEFVRGHRVTDAATLEVARMVLVGVLNQDLVSVLVRAGTAAVGLSGADEGLLRVRQRAPELGFVGDVEGVNVGLLEHLMQRSVPVIASIGVGPDGQAYNVNADMAAGAVATAIHASKLVYLSDVAGLMGADGQLISEATTSESERLVEEGVADGGMIPKIESAVTAVRAGVRRAHLIDGRVEHTLILELFTPEGIGTMIVPDDGEPVPEVVEPAGPLEAAS
jgi:acetylglutamate kinase